jgi:Zn-dependent protease with chaperone function
VVRLQQSWRWVVASVAATVLLLSLAYNWALPAVAQVVLRATPLSVDASVGASALLTLDQSGSTQASSMLVAKQMALETELRTELSSLSADLPYWKVVFRKSGMGANAFALPGGTIVVTDKMVELCNGSSKFLSAVLAHELGHLYHRHGMLLLTQVGALGIAASAIWGDFSGTLASVPVLLGAAGYSRDAEREADAFAAKVLIGLHRSPLEMVDVLKALERERQGVTSAESGDTKYNLLAIAFSSHPIGAERQNFFRSVGGGEP